MKTIALNISNVETSIIFISETKKKVYTCFSKKKIRQKELNPFLKIAFIISDMITCVGNISEFFLDSGCYKLVNQTHASRDVESGDPENGYDIT